MEINIRREEDDFTVIRVSTDDIWKDIVIDEKNLCISIESERVHKLQEEYTRLLRIPKEVRTPQQIDELRSVAQKLGVSTETPLVLKLIETLGVTSRQMATAPPC